MEKSKDITLPVELANSRLSLIEIGSLFVLMSLPLMDKKDFDFWKNNDVLKSHITMLIKAGIVFQKRNGDDIELEIDLTNL